MLNITHPDQALFSGHMGRPVLAVCEHFAGSEKLILKALAIQESLGPVFDITCDCEDGAKAGEEIAHAEMVARIICSNANVHGRMGVRIHDHSHKSWQSDVNIIVGQAATKIAYITLPKSTDIQQVREMSEHVQNIARTSGRQTPVPIHVLIETHSALRQAFELAMLPNVEVLDFGLMDFVSDHHGLIPATALRSPGQFEHQLLVRAKADVVAAAAAAGIIPTHNVCLNLKDEVEIRSDASRAKMEFGFQRMWSIHPAQIEPIVAAMQPGFDELEDAVAILILAQDARWGPIQFKGELHDRATYRYFWSLLKRSHQSGMRIADEARDRFFN